MGDSQSSSQADGGKLKDFFAEIKAVIGGAIVGFALNQLGRLSPWKIPDVALSLLSMFGFFIGIWGMTMIHQGPPWKKAAKAALSTGVLPNLWLIGAVLIGKGFEPYAPVMMLAVGLTFGFILPILWVTGKMR